MPIAAAYIASHVPNIKIALLGPIVPQSNPVLLELWKDQAALDAHAKLQAQRPPLPEGLRLGAGEREDYTHNRTR